MPRLRPGVLLLAGALTLTGCSRQDAPPAPPPTVAEVPRLPVGRGDLVLQPGGHLSPQGYVPPLRLNVSKGWKSTRRGDDAFDLIQPQRGTPVLTVAFVTPLQRTSVLALKLVPKSVRDRSRPVTDTLFQLPTSGFEVTGGDGVLLRSPRGTLSVRLVRGQRVRLLGTDVDGVPLLVAVVVPDAARWEELLPRADALLADVHPT